MPRHEHFMQLALKLAVKAYGQTSPNPMVGAVVVKGGRVVGEGYHLRAGLAHAEIAALRRAGKKAHGADLYVNLEPCCYFGRTPACTDTIIKAGIRRVIYGMRDPNPRISGSGLKILKSAGIKIIGPVLENSCVKLNRAYVKWITTGMPYVTAKIAITLDGKIADSNGNSKWISSKASRTYAHWLRAGVDVVMVGAATARRDRPRLNVRLPGYKGKQPVPMVVGSRGGRRVNIEKLMKELGAAGFQSVLVEGGSALHSEFFKKGLVDYLVVFIAPKLLGSSGKGWLSDIGHRSIKNPLNMIFEHAFMLGGDGILEGAPCHGVRHNYLTIDKKGPIL